MCCIPEIMNETEPNEWATFNPAEFFKAQRQIGQDPYVCGDIIGFRIVQDARADCLYQWAALYDSEGRERAAYASGRWSARGKYQAVVPLG